MRSVSSSLRAFWKAPENEDASSSDSASAGPESFSNCGALFQGSCCLEFMKFSAQNRQFYPKPSQLVSPVQLFQRNERN